MQITLANPRGFCAGVDRAIAIVESALKLFGAPVYVRHEVVHNKYVVNELRDKGAIFVEELNEVPDNATVIFSAHGVSKSVREVASRRKLRVYDAICPLVTKVHMEVGRYQDEGRECILIGHAGHPEVEGTLGQYRTNNGEGGIYLIEKVEDVEKLEVKKPDFLAFVTQTTLSMDDTEEIIDALRRRFPEIAGPKKEDICYATQNRQSAVRELAAVVDVVLVVGARNSSNSNRLCEVGSDSGTESYLVEHPSQFDPAWLEGKKSIGITAGASTPEELVQDVIDRLREYVDLQISTMDGIVETVRFSLPPQLASVGAG